MTISIIDRLHFELVEELEQHSGEDMATRSTAAARLEKIISRNAIPLTQRDSVTERILNRIFGLGPLEPLIADPEITEIMVNGCQSVYIERKGKLLPQSIEFTSNEEISQIINRIVSAVGRRIDESVPMVDARLPDGSRVNAIIPPLSRIGPVLTIRRFPAEAFSLAKLLERQSLSLAMADFLRSVFLDKQNIIVSGSTGAGKTSTLNALASVIPAAERLITIEDTAEIRLAHPHLVQLEARLPNVEGRGEITIRTLLKNALRMRPDRIIIGEVRGGEALDMLQAMNTGHKGSLTTIHANSPEEALLRLETMAMMADVGLPHYAVRAQIQSALQYVVQQERLSDGSRKIVAISEMEKSPHDGSENFQPLRLKPLFFYDKASQEFRKL